MQHMHKHPITVLLGARIRRLRTHAAITQQVLADRCGVFRTYIGQIEAGLANPSLTTLLQLAAALEVTVKDLFPDNAVDLRSASGETC
jgi:transcriptional regulator with XRE-family HTH domain